MTLNSFKVACLTSLLAALFSPFASGADAAPTDKGIPSASVSAPVAEQSAPQAAATPPATIALKTVSWPVTVPAQGIVVPWQEVRVGTEVGGMRLASVLVNVGDTVKKGQVLARLDSASVETELNTAKAQLAESQATLNQANATLDRAKRLVAAGGVSQQELSSYQTQVHTAEAHLASAQAQVKRQQLRFDNMTLTANDDGIVSSVTADEGTILKAGDELFRLIRQGRLEWRAEVSGETLLRLTPGAEAKVVNPLEQEYAGKVRKISPTIDRKTEKGFVFVELPVDANLKAGLQISGVLNTGKRKASVLPASAILREQSRSFVFLLSTDSKAEKKEVQTGEIRGSLVEIKSGLDNGEKVIEQAGNV